MKNQKLANKILAENPKENAVYITEDGQAFFSRIKANNHTASRKFEKDPEVFFRKGFEPTDEKELETSLADALEKLKNAEHFILDIVEASDLEKEPKAIDPETPDVVAQILQLRESLKEVQAESIKLANELEQAKKELQNMKDIQVETTDENAEDKKETKTKRKE